MTDQDEYQIGIYRAADKKTIGWAFTQGAIEAARLAIAKERDKAAALRRLGRPRHRGATVAHGRPVRPRARILRPRRPRTDADDMMPAVAAGGLG